MPIDQRLRLRDNRGMLHRDHLPRDTGVTEIAETCKRSDLSVVGLRDVEREYRDVAIETEKNARRFWSCERTRNLCSHQAELDRRARVLRSEKERLQAPH